MKENTQQALPSPINFLSKQLTYRREHAGLKNEFIARAIGKHPSEHPRIVDATAGLGKDSFILASLGYEVTMLERSETMYQQLVEALALAAVELPEIVARMHLIHADAIIWLPAQPKDLRPDTIFLDPMFPSRKKSASVKKSMVIVQELVGISDDHALLFETAMKCATRRVIVKRPRTAPKIAERTPTFCLNGKSSRFDIYQI